MEDYKQKYEEALGRARAFSQRWQGIEAIDSELALQELKEIFPELKESEEDEKIRKTLIDFVEQYGHKYYGAIARASAISWLERQGERKPAEGEAETPIKARFGVGDWVVYDTGERVETLQVIKVEEWLPNNPRYMFSDGTWLAGDSNLRLWTARDAKPGDILGYYDHECLFMFSNIEDDHSVKDFCMVGALDGKLYVGQCHDREGLRPATWEQCDLLFRKMAEAGYEWDADKLELRKTGGKSEPRFNIGDWIVYETDEWRKVLQIKLIEDGCYIFTNDSSASFSEESYMHLWTIRDIKPGDVILNRGKTLLVKKLEGLTVESFFVHSISSSLGIVNNFEHTTMPLCEETCRPATEPQRLSLFLNMRRAGYEWDADKLELRFVVPKVKVGDEVRFVPIGEKPQPPADNKPSTKDELQNLIRMRIERDGVNADLNDIDVSNITDMSGLFENSKFNGDISKWSVSRVRNMNGMFNGSKFNGDISKWDVSNVTDMRGMFSNSYFNGDISGWDVSNVKNMGEMFTYSEFNEDISKWDVSNVTDMNLMFCDSAFNGDISKWDVSSVIDMTGMFYNSKFNGDISKWDVSNVKNMSYMFSGSKFNGDISGWNVGKVKDMSYMFYKSTFNGDISKWDVSKVRNMKDMFKNSPLEKNPPQWYKK